MSEDKKKENPDKKSTSYTVEDALKIADELFKISKEKEYNFGAFIHGMIFALEYSQHVYKIPQQQIAKIKRDCRKYFNEIDTLNKK